MNSIAENLYNEKIYVDTSAWFALLYQGDKHHQRISKLYDLLLNNNNVLYTSNMIVGETFTLMRYRITGQSTAAFYYLSIIKSSLRINKINVDEDIEDMAVDILEKYREHKFSYVDASSFAVMEKYNLKYALTLDNHFSIAGFSII